MNVASSPTTSSASAPLVDADTGRLIVRGRIRDVSAANSLYSGMWDSDRIASRNRARIDSMFDGGPPKNPRMGVLAGQAGETQVNWGDAEILLHEECAPYYDLHFSQEVFGSCPIKRDFADDDTRLSYGEIIAEEITNLLKEWPDFISRRIAAIKEMKKHGVAFVYYQDDIDWRSDTAGMEFFKIPRPTKIGVNNIKYCGVQVDMDPEDLWQKIRNPEIAKLAGWDLVTTRNSVMKAAPSTPSSTDFEFWERFWKNNDYMMSYGKNVCPLIYFYSQELDATVSQYLFARDGGKKFLYKRLGRLRNMGSFIHAYVENIGTNVDYHSIRGLGHRLYSIIQKLNRQTNSFSDLVDFAASPIFQPDSEVEADEEATSQSGAFLILNRGWKIPEQKFPNYSDSLIPALSLFGEKLRSRTSRINNSQSQTPNGRMNPAQFQANLEHQAQLSNDAMELYLSAWELEWQEKVRRITRKGYLPVEPGGQQVAELYRRCKERGVPPEAIEAVDWKRCRVNRGIGAGSAAARIVVFDRVEPEIAAADPVAQYKFRRMKVMAIGGVQLANELFPAKQTNRLGDVAAIADMQNNQLIMGMQLPIREDQNHIVTAGIRLQKLAELNAAVAQGGDPVLMQVVEPMHSLLQDMHAHLEMANPNDPTVRQMEKLAQQFNMMVTNGIQHVRKLKDNMAREAAHNAGKVGDDQMEGNGAETPQNGQESQRDPSPDLRLLKESIGLQAKMEDLNFKRASNQEALNQQRKKFRQDEILANLKVAADLRRTRLLS